MDFVSANQKLSAFIVAREDGAAQRNIEHGELLSSTRHANSNNCPRLP